MRSGGQASQVHARDGEVDVREGRDGDVQGLLFLLCNVIPRMVLERAPPAPASVSSPFSRRTAATRVHSLFASLAASSVCTPANTFTLHPHHALHYTGMLTTNCVGTAIKALSEYSAPAAFNTSCS